jgi:hypothetical protein
LYYVTLGTMTFQLTGFRQAVAMGVCMLSVELAKSRRALPFLLLVLVAATFHRTAIVFLPAYFLIGRKPTFTSMTLAVGALVAGTLSAEYITVRGNTLFGTSYGTYVGNLYGGVVPILVYSAAIALSVWHRRSVRSWTGFNLTTAGLTVYVMRYVTLALERVSFYFTSGAIVALPEAIKSEQNAHLRAALQVLAVAGALGLFFYRVATSEWGVYRFFWQ